MPVYTFRNVVTGEQFEKFMSVNELTRIKRRHRRDGAFRVDGVWVWHDIVADHTASKSSRPGMWPMKSYALGVLPSQVKQAMEHAKSIGVPTEFCPKTGDAIFTSRLHRKRYAEATGHYDRNGGYGDPQKRK